MTVTVDPAQLRGYAVQLERNSEFFISPLRRYCTIECARTDGLTGLLALSRPSVSLASHTTADLFTSGERNLYQVATNLRAAAASYQAGDAAAAERIWLRLPRLRAPRGYVDLDDDRHPGDFRDPFAVRPPSPPERTELADYVKEARHHLDIIDDFLSRYLHFSLAERVLPVIVGDWDTLRENADAYAALAGTDGVQAIRTNLAYGMDSLSASWDAPAATEFAFQIRGRWLPALDALQHLLCLHKEAFEVMAQQAETMFEALVLAIEVLKFWVVEKVLRIARIVGAVLGAGRVWDEIVELFSGVLKAWHEITMLFEVIRLTFEGVHESLQAAGAAASVIEDLWLAPGENRLDPVRIGAVPA